MTQAPSSPPEQEVLAYELHGNCYLNITYHCTLRCTFCPKFNGSWEVQGYDLLIKREPSVEEMLAAVGDPSRYQQIVFCGLGEPTLRWEVLLEIAGKLKRQGATIRVNTDGLASLVHGRDVTPELAGKVDALSISMNAQNEEVYDRHCRPKLPGAFPAMLDFSRRAKQYVPEVTLTAINGLEGVDITACRRIAEQEIGVKFRQRELDIVG